MSRIAESIYGDRPAPYRTPGFKEPTTSKEAAIKFKTHAHALSIEVLDAITAAPDGMTADEVAAKLEQSVLAIRPRVSELFERNEIERVPAVRRKNASGMSAAVWRVKT